MNNVIKNSTVFVDGRGYIGDSEDLTPPKLTIKTEAFRQGGMDAELEFDMGMEKLEASFTLTNFDPLVLGLFGFDKGIGTALIFRAAGKSSDGTVTPYIYTMRGVIKELDSGSLKAGEAGKLKVTMSLDFYSLLINNAPIHLIDVKNMKRIIGGIDQLADERKALGV